MIYHPNMSGYPPNTFLIEQADHGEGPDAEEVWNLAANIPDPNEQEPPPPPAGLFNSRTDSINSSTVFVNPNLIQPPNSHRYSGTTVDQQHQQLQQQQHSNNRNSNNRNSNNNNRHSNNSSMLLFILMVVRSFSTLAPRICTPSSIPASSA